jgi:hypothetical protein
MCIQKFCKPCWNWRGSLGRGAAEADARTRRHGSRCSSRWAVANPARSCLDWSATIGRSKIRRANPSSGFARFAPTSPSVCAACCKARAGCASRIPQAQRATVARVSGAIDPEEIVTLVRFGELPAAQLLCGRLESEGIECLIPDEIMAAIRPGISTAPSAAFACKCARPTWNAPSRSSNNRVWPRMPPLPPARKTWLNLPPANAQSRPGATPVTRATTAPSAPAIARPIDPCGSHWSACGSWAWSIPIRLSWPCRRCGARTSRSWGRRRAVIALLRQPARLRWAFAACGAISFALIALDRS